MAEDSPEPIHQMIERMSAPERRAERTRFINTILFRTPGGLRFTQDSPILPNVWTAFALEPHSQQELILTICQDGGTGHAAQELRKMLKALRRRRPEVAGEYRKRARVSYIPGQIAVKLYFDELMRVVLPLTPWWHDVYDLLRKIEHKQAERGNDYPTRWEPFPQPDPAGQRETALVEALMLMRRESDPTLMFANSASGNPSVPETIRRIPPELSWLVRIAGLIGHSFTTGEELLSEAEGISARLWRELEHDEDGERIETSSEKLERLESKNLLTDAAFARATRVEIVKAFVDLYAEWSDGKTYPEDRSVWRVTKNRPVHLAVDKSSLTVKADAARRLFNISCRNITWAVVDSGIDREHPAFRLTTEGEESRVRRANRLKAQEAGVTPGDQLRVRDLKSRVELTLDFTRLRELLDYDIETIEPTKAEHREAYEHDVAEAKKRRTRILTEIARRSRSAEGEATGGMWQPTQDDLDAAEKVLTDLQRRISEGKDISWQDLETAIVDKNPMRPLNDHGTHVAGILAADWIVDDRRERELPLAQRTRRMQGMCPDINLIDVRVYRDDGLTDEFELLAAIQFLRWMNARAGTMKVHGANLSLSLVHDVHRFACGQTPICDECNEASALGMVIVAAAGNKGFEMDNAEKLRVTDGYRDSSITDPGNAENVITVGATHRKRPHEYGVSYFSSRGPTGDGRLKPDLIAPGEKIKGPTPGERSEFKDGTSMAAPHVSGAAAMLMARHTELIGQPVEIKEVLCKTATDLGRERYFQGCGLVDILRALQSV